MRNPADGLRLIVILCLLHAPQGVSAQARSSVSPEAGTALATAGARLTTIRGERTVMVGGGALLRVAPSFAFGGSGWVLTEVLAVDGSDVGGSLGLRVAYGGVQGALTLRRGARVHLELRTLFGAGNAKIELPVVGTEIAADNFFVAEPEAVVGLRIVGPLYATIGFGYRVVAGVEDLPGVGERQLRGALGTIGLVIG